MRLAVILFSFVLLSACSSPSTAQTLTLEQITAAFEDENLQLHTANANPANIVEQGINDVRPSVYTLNDSDKIYLFIFDSEADRKQGREDFYNRPVDFAAHTAYEVNNVLVLLFYGGEELDEDTDASIRTALDHLGSNRAGK
ncbi:hypothetical protein PCCS19_08690 [Paenibacillus sp. CCS19]|uniref:hypothetical protein n=1 Tax=Paenibacillus sp. CCS19 TaxID=3158387 RepID=UPI00256C0A24|nr:hypothetical protein [Paenibacillus cellulosilyticus]GMK37815.1 hypothetical protein PCCS19_08690 [Paenibacillus cellulosilyticus]